ncbi:MAG: Glycine betaine transport system permease protein OpuAB [Deltaproteobacteria bacterium ADurb.BinA179]|jgi:glycine betaine/proline transport system permease protein|nr:proline/glycine betaine ABC transporter permease [Pseudomonadota bacterium]NLW67721.1 proline/glycine betaine ABC transporter permease [Bacteriovoracaceae bacterium]OPZ29074.1 MAG: Glycine betaine transport system permease protein OpuAB [Deltaproteobacteria bacterium ADurb.BinA179]HNR51851.1 proline/glycine betaine ABC transporter permease [Deltaproteobacteria bacterium]HRR69841.1 proline/glycine betaine ABC transporter permease [Desulfomonilia bacterium]
MDWLNNIPRIPIGDAIDYAITLFSDNFSFLTKAFSDVVESGIAILIQGLMFFPPWVLILAFTALAWFLSRKRSVMLLTLIGLFLIWNMKLWGPMVSTLALVLVSTVIAMIIGLPLGIFAALSQRAYGVIMPILDVMQTMPAFVYLIPAIPLFGLGPVGAIFSTVIFSMPPAIRLTCLGIRQVPIELVEAADSFGSTRRQKLIKLQLPMATPTIMAGINQTIMLALSMVVIAAMIGAKGLGGEVWKAIQRLEPSRGFEAGIAIVIVAMILDRIMQRVGGKQTGATSQ